MRIATRDEIDSVLAESLPGLLRPHGFVMPAASPRRWVRARLPLREVFEIAPRKGAALVPRWGLSLEFVPHIQGDSIRWHRTDKNAVLDIVYDPGDFDAESNGSLGITMIEPPIHAYRPVPDVLGDATRRALDWFATFGPEMRAFATSRASAASSIAGAIFGAPSPDPSDDRLSFSSLPVPAQGFEPR